MVHSSLKKNVLMSTILTMSSFLFPLITFPYISRILLPVGTGKINFATSVVTYFAMFAQLGIPTYGIRVCAKVRDDREKLSGTVQELVIINLIMCACAYIVFTFSLVYIPKFQVEKMLLIITSVSIFLNALGVEWLYRAMEQFSYITIRSLIFKVFSVIAMFAFVHKQEDYLIYGAITVIASSASSVLNFINLRKFITLRSVGHYNLKQHIKPIMVFFALSVTTTIYTNLDNVMLGFMTNDEQVGYYGASVKIKNVLLSLIVSVGSVLLPRASYYVDKGYMKEFQKILAKTMHFIMVVSAPLWVYFTIFAREGIVFLSGNNYEPSILPMQIIMPTLILIGISNTIGIQMLVPLGKEKLVVYSTLCGAVTDLILNAILIPYLDSVGAAVGTLAAETVVTLYQIRVVNQDRLKLFCDIKWYKIVIALIIALFSCIWVKLLPYNVFFVLVISAVIFFGIYLILMLLMKDTLICEILQQVILNRFRKNN